MQSLNGKIQHAAEIIATADALVICAGAGMGVDSGLPDFRGNEGFWKAYPALKQAQLDFTEVASPRTFVQDPALAWGFYGHRLRLYRETRPHAGFLLLRAWAQSKPLGFRVFTSNVDGQFQTAGFDDACIHECHGSIHHLQCMDGCRDDIWSAASFEHDVNDATCRLVSPMPTCPHCGGLARPNVMMFGDWGWLGHCSLAQARRETNWLSTLADQGVRVAVVEMGAGTSIPSVRSFSHSLVRRFDARLVRINLREPQVPSIDDVGLDLGALDALQRIDACMSEL